MDQSKKATDGEMPPFDITPEMIDVGARRLLRFSRQRDVEEDAAREIFLAMWRLRPPGEA
jgi:hypothetical protein